MARDNTACGQSILRCFGRCALMLNARRVEASATPGSGMATRPTGGTGRGGLLPSG